MDEAEGRVPLRRVSLSPFDYHCHVRSLELINLFFFLKPRGENPKQKARDLKLNPSTLMKHIQVPISTIMANTFMFRDPAQDPMPEAFKFEGVRHSSFSLLDIFLEPGSRMSVIRPESDPIIKRLDRLYYEHHDFHRINGREQESDVTETAQELMDKTAPVSSEQLGILFGKDGKPMKDGPETDKAYITLAMRYVDPPHKNPDGGMFTRPGACKFTSCSDSMTR